MRREAFHMKGSFRASGVKWEVGVIMWKSDTDVKGPFEIKGGSEVKGGV